MYRTFRAWLGLAGLLAYAAFAVPRIVPALEGSQKRVREAGRHLDETEDAVLGRFRTHSYVKAIRRIRATIPRDAAYFLLPGDDGHGDYFVRFDLAPRRPILLDKPGEAPPGPYDAIVAAFGKERKIVLSDDTPFAEHLKTLESVEGLSDLVLKHAKPRDHFERAFLMELVLEGLVQNLRIAREDLDSTVTYAELAKFNLMRSRG